MKSGHASDTAEAMAAIRALVTALPPARRIFEDPYAAQFMLSEYRWARPLLKMPALLPAVFRVFETLYPGALKQNAVRHRAFDDAVKAALDDGIKTVLILGAGYDARALRFNRHNARFIEVDHPDTQAAKRRALAASLNAGRVTYLAVDFERDSLAEALKRIDPEGPVQIVWEGCAWFLGEAAVDATLRALADWAPPKSRLCFDVIGADVSRTRPGHRGIRAFYAYNEKRGEPVKWTIADDSLASFLTGRGWQLNNVETTTDCAERYRIPIFKEPLPLMRYAFCSS